MAMDKSGWPARELLFPGFRSFFFTAWDGRVRGFYVFDGRESCNDRGGMFAYFFNL